MEPLFHAEHVHCHRYAPCVCRPVVWMAPTRVDGGGWGSIYGDVEGHLALTVTVVAAG